MKEWICLLMLCPFVCLATDVIDFESAEPSDNPTHEVYQEDGFGFSAPPQFPATPGAGMFFRDSTLIAPNPTPGYFDPPVNGTRYVASFTGAEPLLRRLDGGAFQLHSIDLAEYSSALAIPYTVAIIGSLQGGGMVNTSVTLDGHVDALPDPPDFQTFYFGEEWTDLAEVRFLGSYVDYAGVPLGISFDNIMVSTVPEPSVMALCMLIMAVNLFGKGLLTKQDSFGRRERG